MYGATKAALESLTRVRAAEYGPDAVRVNAVAAGPTRTEGTAVHGEAFESAGQAVALKRLAGTAEIAGPIAFLASPAASCVNGATLSAMGGQPALGRAGDFRSPPPLDRHGTPPSSHRYTCTSARTNCPLRLTERQGGPVRPDHHQEEPTASGLRRRRPRSRRPAASRDPGHRTAVEQRAHASPSSSSSSSTASGSHSGRREPAVGTLAVKP
ncbi:SDR family oxidoreductase [Streptomyces sp. NPDC059787]|uniref:SDR family oxidoreductase n=1 Tax=Streptomyces sp. NPDC059787 TaxID=3346947 RepID=UPI0036469A4D